MIPSEKKLKGIFETECDAIKFAYENNIILPVNSCPRDGFSVSQVSKTQFKCRKKSCRKIISSYTDTVFEKMKLPINDFFRVCYLWLAKVSFMSIITITGHSSHTVERIISKIIKRLSTEIEESTVKIGGIGVEVQLDESKFGKRKYNRGHRIEGAWVFGGVEKTKERKFFAVVVETRDAQTLNDLIIKHVLPGSIVITDGWKGYNMFKKNTDFIHHLVNHSISFKNSESKNTNTIEGTWNGVKRNVPVRCRVKARLPGRLMEFIWRRQKKNDLWNAFIELLI